MSETAADNFPIYYADKLWKLLPEVYRTSDTDQFGKNGPLREMVNRIGATAAELRRGIDRLWEDQSIETCDDWVIPYLADLLDTNLVFGLDPRGQRLDVANTIDYRRRKGTLGVLEQIASDITGWDAKAVEFFRRLGRTRHGLDPPIGPASAAGSDITRLRLAEGLQGALTGTRIGGFADLRNVHGAGKAHTAFDEFFHTADTRAGRGARGWYAIPHLGIFVWRLLSLPVGTVTPVAVRGCPGWFTFDPTGRDISLFARQRLADQFGDNWVSPEEAQLPGPISQALLNDDIALGAAGEGLYGDLGALAVLSVTSGPAGETALLPAAALTLRPAKGRFAYHASPPLDLVTRYCYGFPSLIGAGPFDRRGQAISVPLPDPPAAVSGGGDALITGTQTTAVTTAGSGTITVGDSLTYGGAPDLTVQAALTLRAENEQRPLVRLDPSAPWVITGGSTAASLTLDGLFISGQDIVLRGTFASVTVTCCTLDPGDAAPDGTTDASPPAGLFMIAADGRELVATRLWIEAAVGELTADRCVLGQIRTRLGGTVQTATVSNSTFQTIRTAGLGAIAEAEVKDGPRFLRRIQLGLDPVSAWLRALLQEPASPPLDALLGVRTIPPLAAPVLPPTVLPMLLDRLNQVLEGPSIYQTGAFADVPLSATTSRLLADVAPMRAAPALNRMLLEDAYPLELADAALAFGDGLVKLSRCTVMGRVAAHRLDASECILRELATADDRQDGCIRFTAWANGSVLPRQYESVTVPQGAALFTSTVYGEPGYAQLLPTADLQRLPPASPDGPPQNTILSGAEDGAEMGAYARDRNPIRARALLLKLREFMPAGLVPVVVNVT